MSITVPDGWSEIKPALRDQERAFQRTDGLVVSVEGDRKYSVVFLPENFEDDNQVIQHYGDSGVLCEDCYLDEALEQAEDWMQENPE